MSKYTSSCIKCSKLFTRYLRPERPNQVYCSKSCAGAVTGLKRGDPVARFWSKVKVLGPNDCWLWQGAVDRYGYGAFQAATKHTTKAHRYSLELVLGKLEPAQFACHNCPDGSDNPRCVNPSHLFKGTALENNQDRANKGRNAIGQRSGNAKFTNEQAETIRQEYETCKSIPDLAVKYNVRYQAIEHIVKGISYKGV